jgi:acetoin utilization protein AcuB
MNTALEIINNAIIPLQTSDNLFFALKQMDELRLAHLPVVSDKKLVGIVSDNDLLNAGDENLPVEQFINVMSNISINPGDHFYNALNVMAENKLTLVPVCEDDNFFLGAITADDLIDQCSNVLSVKNPGGIIILNVNESDFSLAEIAQIVESNDTKLLSSGVYSQPDSNMLQITLKLSKINIEPVLQTFSRFGYDVIHYFGENKKDEELLRQRYDSLMMYLKM